MELGTIFGGLLSGSRKDTRLCYHFYDNGDREFIYRDIIGAGISNVDGEKKPTDSWIDYYQTLYPFAGYNSLHPDAVQLTYDRHFLLELHDILPDHLRPPDGDFRTVEEAGQTHYFSSIAEDRAAEIQGKINPKTHFDLVTKILGAAFIMQMLLWGIMYATK